MKIIAAHIFLKYLFQKTSTLVLRNLKILNLRKAIIITLVVHRKIYVKELKGILIKKLFFWHIDTITNLPISKITSVYIFPYTKKILNANL